MCASLDIRYDWVLLRTLVTSGYVGWMLLSAIHVLRTYALPPVIHDSYHTGFGSVLACVFFMAFALRFFLEDAPVTYYFYTAFPAYFWSRILDDSNTFQDVYDWAYSQNLTQSSPYKIILWSFISLECMVLGYFYRFYWTLGWIAIGVLWPAWGVSPAFRSRNQRLLRLWKLTTVVSGIFTLLPVEKGESLPVL